MAKQTKASRASSRSYLRKLYTINRAPNRRRLKRSRRSRRSINFWYMVNEVVYNKIALRDVERVWLMTFQPKTKITKVTIPDCERSPRYKKDLWDGQVYQLTFTDKAAAMNFRLAWWNQKII